MASVTNYNTKNMDKGYCEKCGAFFLYNKTQELYAEHNSFFKFGRSYLYCPGCGSKIYYTYGSKINPETHEKHDYFVS